MESAVASCAARPMLSLRAMGRLPLAIPPLLFLAAIPLQPLGARPAAEADVEARLRGHIETLAADAMEGRKPGTPGGDLAAGYIASQFAGLGLVPGGGDGGFYQPVKLVERRSGTIAADWRVAGTVVPIAPTEMALRGGDGAVRTAALPIVFGGYGVEDARAGLHPFDGVDVKGAAVLILSGQPEGVAHAPGYAARREALLKAGATAVLRIETDEQGWPQLRDTLNEPRNELADDAPAPITGALSPAAWRTIADAAGLSALTPADMVKRDFRARRIDGTAAFSIDNVSRPYTSWNIVGRLPGNDPAAGALLYLAHWDHLGLCRPEGVPDRICNGAVDNASGVAMMLEVARGLIQSGKRPVRDIWFVATTAEEMGLLGAHALAKAPPVDAAKIAAVLNFDTVAIAPRGVPVAMLGRGQPALDAAVDAVSRRMGRRINPSDAANALAQRQDGWAFAQQGIPAAMVGGSLNMDLLQAYLGQEYHKPGDDLSQPLPLDGVAQDVELHVALGLMLADPKRYRPPPR